MRMPKSEDIERFAILGYMAAQAKYDAHGITAWLDLGQTSRDSWCAAAEAILSKVDIVEVEQRTVVFVPEIRFKSE